MDEEKVIEMILNHEGRLKWLEENIVTKADFQSHDQRTAKTLDEILGIVKKVDQELTMMGSRVGRVEEKVERYDKDVKKVKLKLKVA